MGADLNLLLQQRWGDTWLMGLDSHRFWRELDQVSQTLSKSGSEPSLLLIAEADPLRFLTHFFAASSLGHAVILGNPHWGKREWEQVNSALPKLRLDLWPSATARGMGQQPYILIPSGGSSGQLKFVVHTWPTLMASVQGFQAHFGLHQVHAYCVLPLFHVSGLMQVLRVLAGGGCLALQPYRGLKQGKVLPLPEPGFLSLVPTQLQWLLEQGNDYVPWLKTFQAVLLGGAPAWPSLIQQAQEAEIPLALTYGMTETASQVATLLPEEFLAGSISNGRALPHAQIHIVDDQGQSLDRGQTGPVAIRADSLALGYVLPGAAWKFVPLTRLPTKPWAVPTLQGKEEDAGESVQGLFLTDDIGFLDAAGALHIVGRSSSKIITGGENVFPEDIEAVLLASGFIQDACVVGLPDRRWGQQLGAVVVLPGKPQALAHISRVTSRKLAAYQCPKVWIVVQTIPRTPQGKVNRQQTLELAQTVLAIYAPCSLP